MGRLELLKLLSKADLVGIIELVDGSVSCADEKDLRGLVEKLARLISFDFFTCGVARKEGETSIGSYEVLNVSYPAEWLELYIARDYQKVDPITKTNFSEFRLQYWADTYRENAPPAQFVSEAKDFGLANGYTLGMRNLKGNKGSLFSLSGRAIKRNARTELILSTLVPHLHYALERVLGQQRKGQPDKPITSREAEVLKWMKCGKSSWDISVILGISERTVNFHIYNVMHKLDVVKRPQAVAAAMARGLIDID